MKYAFVPSVDRLPPRVRVPKALAPLPSHRAAHLRLAERPIKDHSSGELDAPIGPDPEEDDNKQQDVERQRGPRRPTFLNGLFATSDQSEMFNADEFDSACNSIFLDVDDTIIESGAERLVRNSSVTESDMPPSDANNVFPQALEFINCLSKTKGVIAGVWDFVWNNAKVNITGNLFVTSAQPSFVGAKVFKLFQTTLQQHEPDRLYRNPVGFLWGSRLNIGPLVRAAAYSRWNDILSIRGLRDPEKQREYLEKLGEIKFESIRRQILRIRHDYEPYLRRNRQIFFLGNNIRGDLYTGAKLLKEDLVDFVFIRDLRNLKPIPDKEWAAHDPEAAGVSLYCDLPNKKKNRIVLFRNYSDAILDVMVESAFIPWAY